MKKIGFFVIVIFIAIVSGAKYNPENTRCDSSVSSLLFAATDSIAGKEAKTKIPKEIVIPSTAGAVHFPHQQHFEDFEIECKTCHHEINAAKLTFPHQDYFNDFWIDCKICHHGEGGRKAEAQPCSKCHHKSPSTITDETLSATVVIHKNCWQCHEMGTGAEASQNCKICHSGEKSERK